jgi:hypothetical protein
MKAAIYYYGGANIGHNILCNSHRVSGSIQSRKKLKSNTVNE